MRIDIKYKHTMFIVHWYFSESSGHSIICSRKEKLLIYRLQKFISFIYLEKSTKITSQWVEDW